MPRTTPNCWYIHAMAGKALTNACDYSEAMRHLRMAKLLHPEDAGLVAAIAWVTPWQEKGSCCEAAHARNDQSVRTAAFFLVVAMATRLSGQRSRL